MKIRHSAYVSVKLHCLCITIRANVIVEAQWTTLLSASNLIKAIHRKKLLKSIGRRDSCACCLVGVATSRRLTLPCLFLFASLYMK